MIEDPKALREIRFMDDWDTGKNQVIGRLFIPAALKDARPLVNLFAQYNMVHPDLRTGPLIGQLDPWAEERDKKRTAAYRDFPRQYVYPVEVIIPLMTETGEMAKDENGNTPILYHSLTFKGGDFKRYKRSTPFKLPKEVPSDG